MYLKDVQIAKKVHIVGLNDENIKQLIYFLVPIKVQISREILKLFQKLYLILRYNIVSSFTLYILSVHYNPTDTDKFKLSARVRQPLGRGPILKIDCTAMINRLSW